MRSRAYDVVGALASALCLHTGCDEDGTRGERVEGGVVLVDRTHHALVVGQVRAVNGAYGVNCQGRNSNGSDRWSVAVAPTATLAHPALTVTHGDDCAITLTEVVTSSAQLNAGDVIYAADPPIPLGATYKPLASAFRPSGAAGSMPVPFYANAKLSDAFTGTFSSDFTIQLALSEDPNFAITVDTTAVDQQVAGIDAAGVAAPNYTVTNTLALRTRLGRVVNVTGAANLTPGTVIGEGYALIDGPVDPTIGALDAAFSAHAARGQDDALQPVLTSVPSSSILGLIGDDDLGVSPSVVSLIIANIDPASHVPAYQLVTLTFRPAPTTSPTTDGGGLP